MAFEENFYEEDEEQLSSIGAVCPYCGYINEAGADNPQLYEEDTTECECEHCCKTFKVRLEITYDWWTSKMEQESEEQ